MVLCKYKSEVKFPIEITVNTKLNDNKGVSIKFQTVLKKKNLKIQL